MGVASRRHGVGHDGAFLLYLYLQLTSFIGSVQTMDNVVVTPLSDLICLPSLSGGVTARAGQICTIWVKFLS